MPRFQISRNELTVGDNLHAMEDGFAADYHWGRPQPKKSNSNVDDDDFCSNSV